MIDHLKVITETKKKKKKEQAEELIQRINVNFANLDKLSKAPPIQIPPTTPSASEYPIDEAVDLARKIQAENLAIKSLKDERADRLSQISTIQDELDRLAKSYFSKSQPSEEKFIQGLKLINYHVSQLGLKEDLKRIDTGIKGYEAYVKRLTNELDVAEKNLVATPEDLARVKDAQRNALAEWQSALSLMHQQEAEMISKSADFDTDSASPESRLLQQKQIEAVLQEMIAHEDYISLQIKGALLELLLEPKAVNLNELSEKAEIWSQTLGDLSQRLSKQMISTQREIQRTGQLLSLATPDEPEFSKTRLNQQEIIDLAQKNLLSLQKLKSEIQDSKFILSRLENRLTKEIGGSRRAGQITVQYLKMVWTTLGEWIDTPFFHIGTRPVHLSALLKFIAILMITFWGSSKLVNGINQWAVTKKRIEKSLLYRISRLIYYLMLTIGFIIALTSLGFDFSSFLIIAGALGVGLGFGLQTIFNNFTSGLILLFESQIKVGDFVEIVSGVRGEVKEINVRSTIITMPDGLDVIVPNSEMVTTRVVNWTLNHPYRRLRVPFSVAYGSDYDLVKKVIEEGASKLNLTLVKPGFSDPDVMMKEFADSGVNFELFVWVNEKYAKRPFKAMSDYLWMIERVLRENEIEIPFNQLDIHIK